MTTTTMATTMKDTGREACARGVGHQLSRVELSQALTNAQGKAWHKGHP